MKVDLFGSSGESWNESVSAESCINAIPTIDKSTNTLIFEKFPGTELHYETGDPTDEILSVFCVAAQSTFFSDRVYFIKKTASGAVSCIVFRPGGILTI